MEGKSKNQSKKSLFTTQYTNLLHLLCEGHLYFAFTINIFNKAKAILFSTSHGMLTLILMAMLLLLFVICHPYEKAGEIKLKRFSSFKPMTFRSFQSLNAQVLQQKFTERQKTEQNSTENLERKTKYSKKKKKAKWLCKTRCLSFWIPVSNAKCWLSSCHPQEFAWFYKFFYSMIRNKACMYPAQKFQPCTIQIGNRSLLHKM